MKYKPDYKLRKEQAQKFLANTNDIVIISFVWKFLLITCKPKKTDK